MAPADRPSAADADWLRRVAATHGPAGPCPDENSLAAFFDGSAQDHGRDGIELHVAACLDCQEVLAALAAAHSPARGAVRPARSLARKIALAAAAVLLAGLGIYLVSRPPLLVAQRFELAARDLAAADPTLFGQLPIPDDELRRAPGDGTRGGGDGVQPGGVLLTTPANIRWQPKPVLGAWTCRLYDDAGREVWRRATTSTAPELPWPPGAPNLPAGAYVFEATARGVAGSTDARGSFRIADEAVRNALAKVRTTLARIGEPERDLLLAQWALRQDLRHVAVEAARAAWTHPAARALVRPTLRQALLRVGADDESNRLEAREK